MNYFIFEVYGSTVAQWQTSTNISMSLNKQNSSAAAAVNKTTNKSKSCYEEQVLNVGVNNLLYDKLTTNLDN